MSHANILWGAPRIHGELLKLGIEVSQATVRRYMIKRRKPPSQTWHTFLDNHSKDLASIDFFIVPTVTFKILYVFVVLSHDRRKIVHFNVTSSPTAFWTGQQVIEAFPWDTAPNTCFETMTRSMDLSSQSVLMRPGSSKSRLRSGHLGRMPTVKE